MKAKDVTLSAILLALLIIFSQLSLPIGPIPITLQTMAVLLIGYFLSPKNALIVTFTYSLGGLIGLPFFSNFQGGLQSILLPSFGFILAFPIAAFLQAKVLERIEFPTTNHLIIAGVINVMTTYFIGLIYMATILNFYLGQDLSFTGILMAGLIPFIPGDILKLLISVVLTKRLLPFIKQKTVSF